MNAMIVRPSGIIDAPASQSVGASAGEHERGARRDRPEREVAHRAATGTRLAMTIAPTNDPTPGERRERRRTCRRRRRTSAWRAAARSTAKLNDDREHDRHHDQRPSQLVGRPHVAATPPRRWPRSRGRALLRRAAPPSASRAARRAPPRRRGRRSGSRSRCRPSRSPRPRSTAPTMREPMNTALFKLTALRQVVLADHLHVEALARRVVEGGHQAGGERERVDHPQLGDVGRGQREQRERERRRTSPGSAIRMFRLSYRSASIPPNAPTSRIGQERRARC